MYVRFGNGFAWFHLTPHISNPLSLCLTKKPRLALARFAQAITVQFLFPCLPFINFLNSHLHPLSPIWGPTSVILWLWQTFSMFKIFKFLLQKKKKKPNILYKKQKKSHFFNSSLKYWGLTLPDQTGTVAEVKFIETATKPYINSGSWPNIRLWILGGVRTKQSSINIKTIQKLKLKKKKSPFVQEMCSTL